VAVNSDPSWSPDGKQIIFASDRDGNTNIYAMNADGTEVRRLTDDPGEDVTPFWGIIQVGASGGVQGSGTAGDAGVSVATHAARPQLPPFVLRRSGIVLV